MKKKNDKMGRNDLCWCGSGKKFKDCHLLFVSNQRYPERWEIDRLVRKNFSYKICLVPEKLINECNGQIVRAHSIPKSSSLKEIARNGHVYGFIPSLEAASNSLEGKIYPQLIGINEASTFTGFCNLHDTKLFSEIEDKVFTGTPKQCFLLAYRALAMGIFRKIAEIETLKYQRKLLAGTQILGKDPVLKNWFLATQKGSDISDKDNKYFKNIYDKILVSENYHKVKAYIIKFSNTPSIMCCSSFYPQKDFKGKTLQNIGDISIIPELLNFNLYNGGSGGIGVFSWIPDGSGACEKIISSLRNVSPERITDALIRMMFSYSENTFIKPDWWENLDSKKRDSLVNRLHKAAAPIYTDTSDDITEDGYSYSNWEISGYQVLGIT